MLVLNQCFKATIVLILVVLHSPLHAYLYIVFFLFSVGWNSRETAGEAKKPAERTLTENRWGATTGLFILSFFHAHTHLALLFISLLFTSFPSLLLTVFLATAPAAFGARVWCWARALTWGDLRLPAGWAREQRPAERCPVQPNTQPRQRWLGPSLQLQHAPFQLAQSQLQLGQQHSLAGQLLILQHHHVRIGAHGYLIPTLSLCPIMPYFSLDYGHRSRITERCLNVCKGFLSCFIFQVTPLKSASFYHFF